MKKTVVLTGILLFILLIGCTNNKESIEKKPFDIDKENPDVVVIGSELEGAYLARAAHDEGLKVLILDPREHVGGQVLQGQMLFLDEPTDDESKTLLQGNVQKLFQAFKKGEIRKHREFQAYFDELLSGIRVESGIEIIDIQIVQQERKTIRKLTYKNSEGEERTIQSKYWVENTDFTYLTSKLSNDRIPGVETIFNVDEKDYMASSLMMKFKGVDWSTFQKEVNALDSAAKESRYGVTTFVTDTFTWGFGEVGRSFQPSRDDLFLRGLNILNQTDGEALINALLIYDVDPSDEARVREAVELGKAETERVLAHLQKELPGWENAEINDFPDYLYIRDYDRYETEYVLSATDLLSGKMFWDNVSIAGYPLDIQGIKRSPWGISLGNPDRYGMPLRSFILKDYTNVIVAGKNVGASAAAYGSARIQPNTALAGEVIGIILGQINGEKDLLDLTEDEMKNLHEYIEKKYQIKLYGEDGANKLLQYSQEELELIDLGQLAVKK